MGNQKKYLKSIVVSRFLIVGLLAGCSKDSTAMLSADLENNPISQEDRDALLFMLEEEKLARDTYVYLDEFWKLNQFSNIKNSEQSHMEAVDGLLKLYDISYSILPDGEFANDELQGLYDRFVMHGSVNETQALEVGATIEDMDIVDLENYLAETNDTQVKAVFESLQCGSRNHLRSFTSSLGNLGNTYVPQYLPLDDYDAIIKDGNDQCGR